MSLFTTKQQAAKIHVVGMFELSYDKLANYISKLYWPVSRIVGVKPTGWTYSGGTKIVSKRTNKQGNITVFEVPYSEHSSLDELQAFVKLVNPKHIVPTMNTSTESVKAMLSLLASPPYLFDNQ